MKTLLLPLSWLYGSAVAGRNKAFDGGWLKSEDVGVPVISVGNMTAGGTGKTPFVDYLVRKCEMRGKRVAVISRGYGRRSSGVVIVSDGKQLLADAGTGGDEPVLVARKNPKAIVVVGEKRVAAARIATASFGAEVILLDDGFQHRYIRRGMDIVVIDSTQNLLQEPMLPAGFRREPLAGLRRATLLAFSNLKEDSFSTTSQRDFNKRFAVPMIGFRYKPAGLFRFSDHSRVNLERLQGSRVLAFSGIGNHIRFVEGLKEQGIAVVGDVRFPDHHVYRGADLSRIAGRMKDIRAEVCVTTEKDIVRMMGAQRVAESSMTSLHLHYSRIEVEIVAGENILNKMIDAYVGEK